jgi:Fungal chitosanase of glycosyl hydrolase group 75
MSASRISSLLIAASATVAFAQSPYKPPVASAGEVSGIDFKSSPSLTTLQTRFSTCDRTDMCDGETLKKPYKCSSDPSRNTAILKLKGDVIFYDAKMAIDADGSALSKARGGTNLPETAWHYPTPPGDSVDAEHVPYTVLSKEFVAAKYASLRQGITIHTGDIAAVVYNGKTQYALVADTGPACKIGEGSMKLHDELGNKACDELGPKGICKTASNNGLPKDVMFFIFPHSAGLISKGLTPANVNQRLKDQGPKLMQKLKDASAPEK